MSWARSSGLRLEGWRTSFVWAVVGSLREAALFWMDHWRRRLRAGSFILGGVVVCDVVVCDVVVWENL